MKVERKFWDAPLVVPGKNDPRDPPHHEEEIRQRIGRL